MGQLRRTRGGGDDECDFAMEEVCTEHCVGGAETGGGDEGREDGVCEAEGGEGVVGWEGEVVDYGRD